MARQQIDLSGLARLRPPRVTRSQVFRDRHDWDTSDLPLEQKTDIHIRSKEYFSVYKSTSIMADTHCPPG